jgi:hypothetical protein
MCFLECIALLITTKGHWVDTYRVRLQITIEVKTYMQTNMLQIGTSSEIVAHNFSSLLERKLICR